MPQTLNPLTVQRLAYIRFIYQEGIEQSRQPSVLSARALTSFHDATENLLGLVVEHLEIDVKKAPEFLGYWETVRPKYQLPNRAGMKRLNDWRVALKHNGTFPSEHQIEQARAAVAGFFHTVAADVFGVDFDSIDMVDLLTQPETVRLLREAQTHADIGDYPMAMAGLVLAFDALLAHYATRDRPASASPFKFGSTIYRMDEPKEREMPKDAGSRHLLPKLKKIHSFAAAGQDALRVMSLGIDYPSLARFRVMSPSVHGYYDGSQRFVDLPSLRTLTEDDYNWARHFIIESGLRASRADEIRGMQERAYELDWNPSEPYGERSWKGPAGDPPEDDGVSAFEAEA
ncbi:hypothetical protein [Streptomyces sp. NPDC056160]|uniref:hypothetical protein n=1 Tax=Streptomyces sp. NPDC056160 TaxID=3345731 RepID=UPI0035DA4A22